MSSPSSSRPDPLSALPIHSTFAECVSRWVATHRIASPTQAQHLQLHAMMPPLGRVDAQLLSHYHECRQLSLSSNSISTMPLFFGLPHLRILSLGRNRIRRIDGLHDVASSLEQLWLSYNQIETLAGSGGLDKCLGLTHLYLSNNNISRLDQLLAVRHLPLTDLILCGNPCYENWTPADVRVMILHRLPSLRKIDGQAVTERERIAASQLSEEDARMTPEATYARREREAARGEKDAAEREKELARGNEHAAGLSTPSKSTLNPSVLSSHNASSRTRQRSGQWPSSAVLLSPPAAGARLSPRPPSSASGSATSPLRHSPSQNSTGANGGGARPVSSRKRVTQAQAYDAAMSAAASSTAAASASASAKSAEHDEAKGASATADGATTTTTTMAKHVRTRSTDVEIKHSSDVTISKHKKDGSKGLVTMAAIAAALSSSQDNINTIVQHNDDDDDGDVTSPIPSSFPPPLFPLSAAVASVVSAPLSPRSSTISVAFAIPASSPTSPIVAVADK